jgi:HEAT repeat protein
MAAVSELALSNSAKILEPLARTLKNDPSEKVRFNACQVLTRFRPVGPVLDAMISALGDSSSRISESAASSLCDYSKSWNDQGLLHVIEMLGRSRTAGALRVLVFLGANTAGEPRRNAVRVLRGMGYRPRDLTEEAKMLAAEDRFDEMVALGASAVPALLEEIKGRSKRARRAEEALRKMRDPQAVPLLLEGARGEDEYIRTASLETLGNMRATAAVEPLIGLLKWPGKQSVVRALGAIGDPRAVAPLIAALEDVNLWWEAVKAMVKMEIHDAAATEPLVRCLVREKRVSGDIRDAAIKIFKSIGDPRAAELLLDALERIADWNGRLEIWLILQHIVDRKLTERLVKDLNHPHEQVRHYSADLLGRTGDRRAIEPLVPVLSSNPFAIEAIGEIGDARVVGMLTGFLGQKEVARRAVGALQKILEKAPSDVGLEDLQRLASMDRVISREPDPDHHMRDDWAVQPPAMVETPVDCSRLRNLARQELQRRN